MSSTPARGAPTEPQDRQATINGLQTHWLDWGRNGRPVVLLHGSLSTCHVWDFFARAIADRYWVLVPDLRGYGLTDKPATGYAAADYAIDLEAFAQEVVGQSFHLVGHSMGTRIGAIYAAEHPERLLSLALVDTTGFNTQADRSAGRETDEHRQMHFSSKQEAMEYLSRKHNKNFWPPEVLAHRVETEMRHFPDGRVEWMYPRESKLRVGAATADDVLPNAGRIRCPTLILWGSESPHINGNQAAQLGRLVPHSQVVEIKGAAHYIHLDQREAFEEVTARFLDEVDRRFQTPG